MRFFKNICCFIIATIVLLNLTACKQNIDYFSYVSELRKNIFTAQNEQLSLLVYAGAKENPAIFDGVKNETRLILGVKVIFNEEPQTAIVATLCFDDKSYELPLDFHPVKRALAGEIEVPVLPEKSVDVVLCYDQKEVCLTASSRLNENTISYSKALDSVTPKADDFFKEHTKNGILKAEIIIRLLCEQNKNYYYVGLVCEEGLKRSYLVDGISGEVVAEKIS